MDLHEKIRKLQEVLDELKREVGYSDSSEDSGDELGTEINLSGGYEEEEPGHFETHRL